MCRGAIESERQHFREISIFVLSENGESIITSSSIARPTGTSFRLPKRKDKHGMYVKFRNRKVYESHWIKVNTLNHAT